MVHATKNIKHKHTNTHSHKHTKPQTPCKANVYKLSKKVDVSDVYRSHVVNREVLSRRLE